MTVTSGRTWKDSVGEFVIGWPLYLIGLPLRGIAWTVDTTREWWWTR